MRYFGLSTRMATSAVLGISLCALSFAQSGEIKPSAAKQMQILMNEKLSRNTVEQKIDSNLLHAVRKSLGQAGYLEQLPHFQVPNFEEFDQRVTIDIRADVNQSLLAAIIDLDGEVVNSFTQYHAIRARLPLANMLVLAAASDVYAIRPAGQMMTQSLNRGGVNVTEGDVAHATDQVRSQFNVDGSGITVGVISDSAEALQDLITSGDLPGTATVLPGQGGTGTSEGTALMEIVFDMAPGANLIFATAQGGEAQFAQNILDLFDAGCTVIVDDALYFAEAVFQDGVVAQAVDLVSGAGVNYFTSAGNSGNFDDGTSGVFEGPYNPIAPPTVLDGLLQSAHDFGSNLPNNLITLDSPFFYTLQWNDPYNQPVNDFDLFILNGASDEIIAASTNVQSTFPFTFEIIDSRERVDTNNNIVVGLASGEAFRLGDTQPVINVNSHRGTIQVNTPSQIFGHPGSNGAITTGAVNVATANNGAFTGGPNNPIETFSSDGPRTIFFDAFGTPLSEPEVRQKPDVAAADGVSTNTPGFNPFFGTSASAPHGAGISALFQEAFPGLSTSTARDIFLGSALDIEDTGFDRNSGNGIMMGDEVMNTPIFADGFESGNTSAWTK